MAYQDQIRDFYDRFGARQDRQAFYEDRATALLIERSNLPEASAVFELGAGTGRLAERMLCDRLNTSCRYVGIDVSTTMVGLATRRLEKWKDRASVRQTGSSPEIPAEDLSFDRVVATYVLDLLPEERIALFVNEAHRILVPGGLLCLVSLAEGRTLGSRIVCSLWKTVHRINPLLVGGCRPIRLTRYVTLGPWAYRFHGTVTALGVPSEVLVAEKRELKAE